MPLSKSEYAKRRFGQVMSIIERMPLRALCAGEIQTQLVSVLDQAAQLASPCTGVDRSLLAIERRTSSPLPKSIDSQDMLFVRGHCPDSWAFSDLTQTSSCAGVVLTRSPGTIQLFTRKTWWLRGRAFASMPTATQTIINHHTSGAAFCAVRNRSRRRSSYSIRPHSGPRKPRMNDLGTWAEL
ncbi:hypothetical protein [Pseudomonas sp. 44 R 15]|nr:hypothetical protein [Pseudomonas sp. 44 R 15]